ncbi:MAG: DNA-binding MarR family transcriptional regulator [Paracoccaceae bacterium]|jgi:DNA-binding MarR family transcriptional regulator
MTDILPVMTETKRSQGAKGGASGTGLGNPNGILPFPHVTGYWVNRLGGAFRTAVDRELKELDLTRRQVAMLVHVERAEASGGHDERPCPTASDLTRALGVDSTAVTRMVDRLEEKGLVERSPDPDDGRRHLIRLTRAAESLMPQLKDIAQRVEARFEADIPTEDLHAFQRVILQMLDNVGESQEAILFHE